MRMTISKKLIGSYLVLAMLVLLNGIVGYVVLDKSSQSADTVAKEKAPVQYSVMNAALTIEKVEKSVNQYNNATTGLDELDKEIGFALDEFDMWIAMMQHGTSSEQFTSSSSGAIYKRKNMVIAVPMGSEKILAILRTTLKEGINLRTAVSELIESRNRYVSYTVDVAGKTYSLPDFLNLAQIAHLDWLRQLKDAVNIETTFTGITDPTQGFLGEWLSSDVQVDSAEFTKVFGKLKKQHKKLFDLAIKINGKDSYKDKLRLLNRGIGVTSKIEKYFGQMHGLSSTIYKELDAITDQRLVAMITSADNINGQLDILINNAADEMTEALVVADTVKSRGILFLSVITLAAVVIAGIMGTVISRYLANRISYLAEATRKIADGDLRKNITVTSEDELGDLGNDTNGMISSLREMIGQVLSFSGNLTQSSKDLAGISDSLDENAVDLSSKSTQATEETSQMSNAMLNISTIANDSMQRVQNVALATEEMIATINEIAENTEQARSVSTKAVVTVEKTTVKMNELSDAAKEIGKVVDVIINIADQTNLLSLNATIEAARAGEAGKGFAVVANEVKELAGQTNLATGDIREKISAIQQSSDMTISEINEIAEVINNINSIVVIIAGAVEEQAVTTRQISEDISSVSSGIESMTGSVDSATEVAGSVSNDISAVSETSKNVQTGSTEINKSAVELATLAEELQILVGKFQL